MTEKKGTTTIEIEVVQGGQDLLSSSAKVPLICAFMVDHPAGPPWSGRVVRQKPGSRSVTKGLEAARCRPTGLAGHKCGTVTSMTSPPMEAFDEWVLATGCPKCGAPPGETCRLRAKRSQDWSTSHNARFQRTIARRKETVGLREDRLATESLSVERDLSTDPQINWRARADGKEHVLIQGEHFTRDPLKVRRAAGMWATRNGLRAVSRIEPGPCIIVKFVPKTGRV